MRAIGILVIGLVIGAMAGGAVGAFMVSHQILNFPATSTSTNADILTPEAAGAKVVDFISNYGGLPPGVNVTLINVTEAVEDANLYKIAVNMSAGGISRAIETYVTKDGKILFPEGIDIEKRKAQIEQQKQQQQQQRRRRTIGNFIRSGDEVCTEDGKPVIYFFGSEGCPHCKWEHPVIADVASKFEGYISFHDNMNNFTADRDIFSRYSTGSVPTIVLGCRYYRVGSGEREGKEQEARVLTALICNLTEDKPVEVCSAPEIRDLIAEISAPASDEQG